MSYFSWKTVSTAFVAICVIASSAARADEKRPNIVIIWGDDVGRSNVSAYTQGMMGYRTPNIDRVAREGMLFTDYYAEQSCTAGRASFIMGQHGMRTGLTKVGLPGAALGMRQEDPTIAGLLKPLGYATGQFGKNHLGDRDEMLPTNNGFDEFYGNLYHLNAEEEPEHPDYPKDPEFRKKYGPRGVLHSFADGRIEDTGPLTRKRMETIDDDVADRAADFMERQTKADKPFFVWVNFTHMHFRTHVKPESKGQSGRWMGEYADAMIDHDKNVGTVLDKIDELGIGDNTFVMYSTDNGPHMNSWPDAAMTPFRNEKNSNWEGAYRVPAMVRYPGKIKPGSVSNEIVSHLDWLPTLLAMAGEPNIKEKLLEGHKAIGRDYKVHLDGYNLLPYLTGEEEECPRESFIYANDDQQITSLRFDNWKLVFMEQRAAGTLQIWSEPFVSLRLPKMFNLRLDPYERADITSNTYYDWVLDHAFLLVPAQDYVGNFLSTFKDFPPRQKAASFNLDEVLKKLQEGGGSK
ncbi:arylsulfatase [Novipirellula artificiosorum]|uniref:Arylsulfatase n=1 Tax=Novipirellula artificiosorum TaxID=2528016 RepID=A0A5C6E3V6_9BACT|nr:arylsulfatase [Novipirellula artificiosorum]TWU42667.1 Arylsulfatase [Novipirellula artificiosorum]